MSKVIIAGSRTISDVQIIEKAIKNSGFDITEVVSGCARGVDTIAIMWGEVHRIPVKKYPAEWNKYGKSAGYRRNTDMANYADCLIAIWDGKSKGTKHMIDIATKKGLKVYVSKMSPMQ